MGGLIKEQLSGTSLKASIVSGIEVKRLGEEPRLGKKLQVAHVREVHRECLA